MLSRFVATALLLVAFLAIPTAGVGITTASTARSATDVATETVDADASAVSSHPVTLSGHVDTENGTPPDETYVVVQNASSSAFEDLALSRDVHDGFRKLARTGGDGDPVYVARVGADGHYAFSLPPGAYDLVVVSPTGLSRLHHVSLDGDRTLNATVDSGRVQALHGVDATVTPGETATVRVSLSNDDDEALTDLRVHLGTLPDGVSIVGVDPSGNGTYDATNRTITWPSVVTGETANATIRVRLADDASGSKTIRLDGSANAHLIEHVDPVRLTVRDSNASSTTTLLLGGEGETTPRTGTSATDTSGTSPSTTTPSSSPSGTSSTTVPGFGVSVVALAILVLVTASTGRR